MPQTSIVEPAPALAGALAYPARPNARGSYLNDNSADIAFGLGVVHTGSDNKLKIPTGTAEVTNSFIGAAFRDPTKEFDAGGFVDGDQMTAVEKGWVYVLVDSAVTKSTDAFLRHAGGNEGYFRGDADGGNATAVPTGRFGSSTTGAGIAILELF